MTIGPVIENGFYYDFARNEPFTPEDFAGDRGEDARDHRARRALHQGGLEPRRGQAGLRATRARHYKVELIDAIPEGQDLKIYAQGDWFDLCRGPHMTSTGKIGNAFKLMKVAGAYWRGDSQQPDAEAHLRHRLGRRRKSSTPTCSSSRRPRSATTAGSAASWTCSTSRRRRRASCSGIPRAGRSSRSSISLHAPASTATAATRRSTRRRCSTRPVGDVRPLGLVPREHVLDARRRTSASSRSSR